MPNHSARAIANEFLKRRGNSSWPQQMLVQKLAYIAHGWNLAINGEPLIDEPPEAWDNGPVYRSIWDHVKIYGYGPENCQLQLPRAERPIEEDLSPEEMAVIDHVWKKYGKYSAVELSAMTHRPGTPWFKAYFRSGRNSFLANDDIQNHYEELAMAGRRGA